MILNASIFIQSQLQKFPRFYFFWGFSVCDIHYKLLLNLAFFYITTKVSNFNLWHPGGVTLGSSIATVYRFQFKSTHRNRGSVWYWQLNCRVLPPQKSFIWSTYLAVIQFSHEINLTTVGIDIVKNWSFQHLWNFDN